jgi:hypothetical protein
MLFAGDIFGGIHGEAGSERFISIAEAAP